MGCLHYGPGQPTSSHDAHATSACEALCEIAELEWDVHTTVLDNSCLHNDDSGRLDDPRILRESLCGIDEMLGGGQEDDIEKALQMVKGVDTGFSTYQLKTMVGSDKPMRIKLTRCSPGDVPTIIDAAARRLGMEPLCERKSQRARSVPPPKEGGRTASSTASTSAPSMSSKTGKGRATPSSFGEGRGRASTVGDKEAQGGKPRQASKEVSKPRSQRSASVPPKQFKESRGHAPIAETDAELLKTLSLDPEEWCISQGKLGENEFVSGIFLLSSVSDAKKVWTRGRDCQFASFVAPQPMLVSDLDATSIKITLIDTVSKVRYVVPAWLHHCGKEPVVPVGTSKPDIELSATNETCVITAEINIKDATDGVRSNPRAAVKELLYMALGSEANIIQDVWAVVQKKDTNYFCKLRVLTSSIDTLLAISDTVRFLVNTPKYANQAYRVVWLKDTDGAPLDLEAAATKMKELEGTLGMVRSERNEKVHYAVRVKADSVKDIKTYLKQDAREAFILKGLPTSVSYADIVVILQQMQWVAEPKADAKRVLNKQASWIVLSSSTPSISSLPVKVGVEHFMVRVEPARKTKTSADQQEAKQEAPAASTSWKGALAGKMVDPKAAKVKHVRGLRTPERHTDFEEADGATNEAEQDEGEAENHEQDDMSEGSPTADETEISDMPATGTARRLFARPKSSLKRPSESSYLMSQLAEQQREVADMRSMMTQILATLHQMQGEATFAEDSRSRSRGRDTSH